LGGDDFFKWTSKIRNGNIKLDFNYFLNDKHTIDFGFQSIYYDFMPSRVEPQGDAVGRFEPFQVDNEYALEPAIYISDEWKINNRFSIMGGLRYSYFAAYGEKESFVYADNKVKSDQSIVDTVYYAPGALVKSYQGLEPRFSMKMTLDSSSSIKIGYNRMRQYLHLISNTTSGLPIDIWKSSDEYVKPMVGDQIAGGYFRNFLDNELEASVEVYYKRIDNVFDYKNGAELFFNDNIESELVAGVGRAYGVEFLLKKDQGKFTGWLSYTLAKTERKTN
jgi:hypothetical protein